MGTGRSGPSFFHPDPRTLDADGKGTLRGERGLLRWLFWVATPFHGGYGTPTGSLKNSKTLVLVSACFSASCQQVRSRTIPSHSGPKRCAVGKKHAFWGKRGTKDGCLGSHDSLGLGNPPRSFIFGAGCQFFMLIAAATCRCQTRKPTSLS